MAVPAAPQERKIPVFGSLLSTWPVGSGVLVDDGVVYAAAGIANHDGTHVYALDAATGKIRWQNSFNARAFREADEPLAIAELQIALQYGRGGWFARAGWRRCR